MNKLSFQIWKPLNEDLLMIYNNWMSQFKSIQTMYYVEVAQVDLLYLLYPPSSDKKYTYSNPVEGVD